MKVPLEGCPVCGEGHLHAKVEQNEVSFKGHNRTLDMHYAWCDVCESEITSVSQVLANKNSMLAFKQEVDALLAGPHSGAVSAELAITSIAGYQGDLR